MSKRTRVLIILACILIGLRIALPYAIEHYVVRTLNKIPQTRAEIHDIDLHLWRGAYQIERLKIWKTTEDPPGFFLAAKEIDLSVEWKELTRGALVGEIHIADPVLTFSAAKGTKDPSKEEKTDVLGRIKELFPVDINRFEISSGTIRFQNTHANPPVDLHIRNLNVVATNLTNSRDLSDSLVAKITGQGTVMSNGFLSFDIKVDPFQKKPTFQLDLKAENIAAPELNDFLLHYAGMNFQRGTIGVYIESAAKDGRLTGYVKPILKNLTIIGDPKKELTVGQKVKEFFAELASKILRNQKRKTVATRIEFEGEFDDPEITVWGAIRQALRHAFVEALQPIIENRIGLEDVES